MVGAGHTRIDVHESDTACTVHTEPSGVPKDGIQVSVDGSVVTLRAQVKPAQETGRWVAQAEDLLKTRQNAKGRACAAFCQVRRSPDQPMNPRLRVLKLPMFGETCVISPSLTPNQRARVAAY